MTCFVYLFSIQGIRSYSIWIKRPLTYPTDRFGRIQGSLALTSNFVLYCSYIRFFSLRTSQLHWYPPKNTISPTPVSWPICTLAQSRDQGPVSDIVGPKSVMTPLHHDTNTIIGVEEHWRDPVHRLELSQESVVTMRMFDLELGLGKDQG